MISKRFDACVSMGGQCVWLVGCIWLAGCQLEGNLNGLAKELGNPDKDNFESPGSLLIDGEYDYPAIEGNSSSGAFITALRADNYLTITSFETLDSCSVGPVRAYRSPRRQDTDNMQASARDILMPVILAATEQEPDRLVFSDLKCKLSAVTLDSAYLPLSDTFSDGDGTIAQDSEGNIWYLDPRRGDKELIAENTIAIANDSRAIFAEGTGGSRWMFTVEGGEVVARDEVFAEVFRAAENVQALIHHKDARGNIALLVRNEGGTWQTIDIGSPEAVETVAENACMSKIYDGKESRQFFWLDCDTGDLKHYDFPSRKTSTLGKGIRNYRILEETDSGPVLLYLDVEGALDSEVGPLYGKWGSGDPVFLGERGNLRLSWVDAKGTQRPIVDWDVEAKTGTLRYAAPGGSLETIAEDVVYISSLGIIADYDGTNGRFSRLSKDELTLVHKRVHPRGLRLDPDKDRERLLISTDVSEDGATLTLVTGESKTQKLTSDVLVDSYGFAINANLVSVLTDRDPDDGRIGTLRMVHIDQPVSQVIGQGVLRALETTWPNAGVLYAAPKADEPGIYFAKATR